MAPGQDWCLECGIAAPGRLGAGAAWRAALTIVAAVLLLVGGAVAASYAALNSRAQQTASSPAPPSAAPQVAQAPPTTTPAPAPVTPPATTSTPTPPPAPTTTSAPTPAPAATPATPATTPTTPATPATPTGHKPLNLGVDIASVYDPYKAATDQTDPSDSYDLNKKTVFTISTPAGKPMGVGLDYDLGSRQKVSRIYVRTTTPGFTIEVYGAKGGLPPDILDTRWQHLASAKSAGTAKGKKGLEKIDLKPGSYHHIVLWFTTPPPADAPGQASGTSTVGISEVRILD
jgi:hypothetical protein